MLLLVAGIAEALQVIHGAGIVHRDLKPSNVLLAADGPRVIDFGIARAADATSLTSSGVTVGTPTFMAPEQAAGSTISPATDVFALGQVAAYAAIGTPAFGEGTSHGVLYRIVHEEPDLSGLPEELRELVTRCLAKDAADRPSVAEVIAAVRRGLRPDAAAPPRGVAAHRRRRRHHHAGGRARARADAAAPAGGAHRGCSGPAADPARPAAGPAGAAAAPGPRHRPRRCRPRWTTRRPRRRGSARRPMRRPPPVRPSRRPRHGRRLRAPPRPTATGPTATGPTAMGTAPQPPKKKRKGLIAALVLVGLLAFAGAGGALVYAVMKDDGGTKQDQATDDNKAKNSGASPAPAGDPTATPGGDGSEAPAAPVQDPTPVDYKGINLPDEYHLSLSDEPVNPTNSDNDTDIDFSYQDSTYSDDEVETETGKLVLLNPGQDGSLATCRSETRFTDSIMTKRLTKGAQMCLTTDYGHVALITFKGYAPKSDPSSYMTVDVRVWRNAVEPKQDS